MLPLNRQVQIASDAAKGAVARLSGTEPPKMEDTETTIPELIARVDKTIDYLKSMKAAQIDGSEDRVIHHQEPPQRVLVHRPGVPAALGAAELLLPCDDDVQPAAS